jgi:magnesium chelatase family protein
MPAGHIRNFCDFSESGFDRYKQVVSDNTVSTRSTDRLAKVARTVADLVDSDKVEPGHVAKAQKYVIGGLLREAF